MLSLSVGTQGTNQYRDIITLQSLLNARFDHFFLLNPIKPPPTFAKRIRVDGQFGPVTQAALDQAIAHQRTPLVVPFNGTIRPRDWFINLLWPTQFANPTGQAIRQQDNYGFGHYNAPRGHRSHDGCDYIARPNQMVVAPMSGIVTRISKPYTSGVDADTLSGVEIVASNGYQCKVWYLEPEHNIVGKLVIAGLSPIGKAKSLQRRYPNGITNHVHIRIHNENNSSINPTTVINV